MTRTRMPMVDQSLSPATVTDADKLLRRNSQGHDTSFGVMRR